MTSAYLGNLSHLSRGTARGQVIKAQMANTQRIARREFTWGDTVWVSWHAGAGVMLER